MKQNLLAITSIAAILATTRYQAIAATFAQDVEFLRQHTDLSGPQLCRLRQHAVGTCRQWQGFSCDGLEMGKNALARLLYVKQRHRFLKRRDYTAIFVIWDLEIKTRYYPGLVRNASSTFGKLSIRVSTRLN